MNKTKPPDPKSCHITKTIFKKFKKHRGKELLYDM